MPTTFGMYCAHLHSDPGVSLFLVIFLFYEYIFAGEEIGHRPFLLFL